MNTHPSSQQKREPDRPLARKDDNYNTVHKWLKRIHGKADHCSNDSTHVAYRFEWANIDGIYEKDLRHFKQLCRSCHAKMDIRESTRQKMRNRAGVPNLKLSKRVGKFTMDGKFIVEYRSVSYAAEQNNVSKGNIMQNIHGKTNHVRGYLWRYL